MTKFCRKWFRRQIFFLLVPLALAFGLGVLLISSNHFLAGRPCGCGQADMSSTGQFDSQEKFAYWDNQDVGYPLSDLLALSWDTRASVPSVLGQTTEERWIEIDLSDQRLYAREGSQVIYEFLISSGKTWTPTVAGEFRVRVKLRYAKMSGGSRELGNYYYLPNVPFIQYFYKDYGLHGAYWHNNFGHPMSHGCVNLSIPDAEKLFYWTRPDIPAGKNIVYASAENPGTRIVIHD